MLITFCVNVYLKMSSQKLYSESIPGTNTEQGFSSPYLIEIQLIIETTEERGEQEVIQVDNEEDENLKDFVNEAQKTKMKELWDNEEDEACEDI